MSNGRIDPADRLEALVREDYERSHPNDTFEDLKRRSKFTKEDKGLLRDWMALAATRAEEQGAAQRDAAYVSGSGQMRKAARCPAIIAATVD